ncbi:nuclear condensing complex subunit [Syncephalis fuscata]|nr:nuclear condensing complex subunit [Syncephalis fuscata]
MPPSNGRLSTGGGVLTSLPTAMPKLFQDSQKVSTTHRRNVLALRKLQTDCAAVKDESDEQGEQAFNDQFLHGLSQILPLKRREPCAEKIIKFIASFLQFAQEKDNAQRSGKSADSEAMDVDHDENMAAVEDSAEETITERLVAYLIRRLLPGLNAKDKNVRFRVCQLLALVVGFVGELDEDLFELFLRGMLDRVRDKEPSIRVQAVLALAKLQNGEGDDVDQLIRLAIQDRMKRDPSSDVRRAAVLNLACDETTYTDLLKRSRDIDAITRRFTFIKPMSNIGDFRMLSIEQREQLIKSGLSERDASVKNACISMLLYQWLPHADNNLLEFLKRLDVMNTVVARQVLEELFMSHPEITQGVEFNDAFWEDLSPEGVLFFRVYLEYCQKKDPDRFEALLPNITAHTLQIQRYSRRMAEAEERGEEDEVDTYEFITVQLITIAKHLDYADEMGRRKMFGLLRDLLLLPSVDEQTITLVLSVLRKLTVNDRDFARVIVEVISEIRGAAEDETEEEDNAIERQLQCLSIARGALETLQDLDEQSPMEAVLGEVIHPAVQSTVPDIRESGIKCLGLYCILDQTQAVDFMPLFIHGVRHGHAEMQLTSLRMVFDLIMIYGMDAMTEKLSNKSDIFSLISDCSEHSDHSMQAVAVEGVSKLLLTGVLTDVETLQSLILLYFHPSTYGNNELRQCLSYFFQIFCYAKSQNQQSLRQVAIQCLLILIQVHDDLDATLLYAMITPLQIGQQLIDWMNPVKVIRSSTKGEQPPVAMTIFGEFAIDLLSTALQESQANCKILVQLANKLTIDDTTSREVLAQLVTQIKRLQESNRVSDAATRRTLEKLYTTTIKLLPAGVQGSAVSSDTEEAPVVDELDALLNDSESEPDTQRPVSKKRGKY